MPAGKVATILIALIAASIVVSAGAAWQMGMTRLLAERTAEWIQGETLRIASHVPLVDFHNPSFHNGLTMVLQGGHRIPIGVALGASGVAYGVAVATGLMFALVTISPVVAGVVILSAVPTWLFSRKVAQGIHSFAFGHTETDRRLTALRNILVSGASACEVRGFEAYPFLSDRWRSLYQVRIADAAELARSWFRGAFRAGLWSALIQGAALGLLIALLERGRLDIASVVIAGVALLQVANQLSRIGSSASQLHEASLFVQEFDRFRCSGLEDPEFPSSTMTPPPLESLDIQNAEFRYPGESEAALKRVSLSLRRGEIVALVGENGAGKTTLARIAAFLYRPEAGSVSWNAVDTAAEPLVHWRQQVTILGQDFARYPLSVAENISLGREAIGDFHSEALLSASHLAGLGGVVNRLKDGYSNLLGPEFSGGTDLSGGEWQRVALARAIYRPASLLVLDEPTAALDARIERQIFDSLSRDRPKRGLLVISHRFSSVRSADRIYVLDKGQVVEEGSHEQLMDAGGLYAEMFRLQSAAFFPEESQETSAGGTNPSVGVE